MQIYDRYVELPVEKGWPFDDVDNYQSVSYIGCHLAMQQFSMFAHSLDPARAASGAAFRARAICRGRVSS